MGSETGKRLFYFNIAQNSFHSGMTIDIDFVKEHG